MCLKLLKWVLLIRISLAFFALLRNERTSVSITMLYMCVYMLVGAFRFKFLTIKKKKLSILLSKIKRHLIRRHCRSVRPAVCLSLSVWDLASTTETFVVFFWTAVQNCLRNTCWEALSFVESGLMIIIFNLKLWRNLCSTSHISYQLWVKFVLWFFHIMSSSSGVEKICVVKTCFIYFRQNTKFYQR